MIRKWPVNIMLVFLLTSLVVTGCSERPAAPFPTPNPAEDALVKQLLDQANDPATASLAITVLQERDGNSQRVVLTHYLDRYIQQRGWGLARVRMELLKGLLAMNYYGVSVGSVLGIQSELPADSNTGFAFLPPRMLAKIANKIAPMWEPQHQLEFVDALAQLFLDLGADTNYVNALVRAMEIRDFLAKLPPASATLVPSPAQASLLKQYASARLGISIKYPNNMIAEENEGSLGFFSPASSEAVIIVKLAERALPSELIALFLQGAKGDEPDLVVEDGRYASLIRGVDQASGTRITHHFEYPSGNEAMYYTDITVILKKETSWVLLVTGSGVDADMANVLAEVVSSLHFQGV